MNSNNPTLIFFKEKPPRLVTKELFSAFSLAHQPIYTCNFNPPKDTLFHQQRIKLLLRNAGCRNYSTRFDDTLRRSINTQSSDESGRCRGKYEPFEEKKHTPMMPIFGLPIFFHLEFYTLPCRANFTHLCSC